MIKMGILKTLVSLSGHESVHVKREVASRGVFTPCAPEKQHWNLGQKCNSEVHKLICFVAKRRMLEEIVQQQSLIFLQMMLIGALGGVTQRGSLLTSPCQSCQKNACRALCWLTTLEENKVSVFCGSGLTFDSVVCLIQRRYLFSVSHGTLQSIHLQGLPDAVCRTQRYIFQSSNNFFLSLVRMQQWSYAI